MQSSSMYLNTGQVLHHLHLMDNQEPSPFFSDMCKNTHSCTEKRTQAERERDERLSACPSLFHVLMK